MRPDLFHALQLTEPAALAAVSLGATGSGGKTTKIVKRDGALGGVLFVVNYGTVTATNAQIVASMTAGDATGSLTAVASADVIGGLAALTAAGIGVTSARASGVSKNVNRSVQYIGLHEYVALSLAPKVSGGMIASVSALLAANRVLPATQAAA